MSLPDSTLKHFLVFDNCSSQIYHRVHVYDVMYVLSYMFVPGLVIFGCYCYIYARLRRFYAQDQVSSTKIELK